MREENACDIRIEVPEFQQLAAICSTSLLAMDLTTGSVNGENFCDYVHGTLIPQMLLSNH